jgi:hypothetical protein
LNANLGIYGQDVWSFKRATLTYGVRYDYVNEQVTGQGAQVGRFVNIPAFSTIPMPTWSTFSPRLAFVYDLSGNGKTALRAGYNRYESAATTTLASLYDPASGLTLSAITTPAWTDLNGDGVAQGNYGCVYLQPGCEINFAQVPKNFGVLSLASPDPNIKRPYVDQMNVGATHEIMSGVSVTAEWFHNISRDQFERNNILRPGSYSNGTVTNANYRAVTVFSPSNGTPITMYDPINSTINSAVQNVDSTDPNIKQTYDAIEFNFNARLPHGIRLFGGTATDRFVANTCAAAATNPNFLITMGGVNYCDQTNSAIPWRTQLKLVATVPLPWWGLMLSGSFQALPGYLLGTQALTQGGAGAPNFTAPSGLGTAWTVTSATTYAVCPGNSAAQGCVVGAKVVPGLLSVLSVPLVQPGTEQTPRLNQMDFSIAKRITIGKWKLDPKIDLFNALNSDGYFTVKSTTFVPVAAGGAATGFPGSNSGGSYLLPASIIQGRLLRIGLVVNF